MASIFWQIWQIYKALSNGMLGSGATFLAHLDPNFGKIISGNMFYQEEDTVGIILSLFCSLSKMKTI